MILPELHRQQILIVDDMPINIQVLAGALKSEYHIKIATSGEKALVIAFSDNAPDLILLDIMMPGMDGYEVCQRLKEDSRTQNIPVIFITAKGEVEDETKGLDMGAADYITKPFHLPIVKARVRTQLNLKRKTDMLEALALLDGLTNIPNRRRFDEVLEREWRRIRRGGDQPMSLIMGDIDAFKNYNDTYGHSAGDDCLVKVARSITSSLTRPTDIVARYGGEEFAIILPDTDSRGATVVAERIQAGISTLALPHVNSPVADHVTLSLGVATTIPIPGLRPGDLVTTADQRLYAAKKEGRNRVKYMELV